MKTIEIVHTITSGSPTSASPTPPPPTPADEPATAAERVSTIEARFTITVQGVKQ
jgi:hypothetical protein